MSYGPNPISQSIDVDLESACRLIAGDASLAASVPRPATLPSTNDHSEARSSPPSSSPSVPARSGVQRPATFLLQSLASRDIALLKKFIRACLQHDIDIILPESLRTCTPEGWASSLDDLYSSLSEVCSPCTVKAMSSHKIEVQLKHQLCLEIVTCHRRLSKSLLASFLPTKSAINTHLAGHVPKLRTSGLYALSLGRRCEESAGVASDLPLTV